MYVFTVKRILEQSDYVVSNRILGIKSLCPCEQFARINGRLLDGETEILSKILCMSELPKSEP